MTIVQVQEYLDCLGYYSGIIKESWGEDAIKACKKFQFDHKIPLSGICDAETESAIIAEVENLIRKIR